jgi:hypothetical protein
MNDDDQLRRLLSEAVSDIEPHDRLLEIRPCSHAAVRSRVLMPDERACLRPEACLMMSRCPPPRWLRSVTR